MKRNIRLKVLLLALAIVVSFMPAAVFADGGSADQTDNDLSHYEIRVNDIKDGDWRVFTDVTSNIKLNVDVVLKDNKDVIADPDKYDLKIIKETHTETETIESECINGQINLDENGTFTGRLFAIAKNGSSLNGETEANYYVDIFHNKTLHPFGPDVRFEPDHMTNGPLPMTNYYLYSTSDSSVVPEVKIDGTVLTKDSDYTVRYRKDGTTGAVDSFPAEPGSYQCLISSIENNPNGYYGGNDSVWLIITAPEDYEQAKKDKDDAQNVINMINDFDFTDPDANKTNAARIAYDALNPAAKAIISEREYGRLEVAEFVLLMKKVDPANYSSEDVKAARVKYDSFCVVAKTVFLGMACEKQGDLVAELESAEKKLKESTSPSVPQPQNPISIQDAKVVLSKTAFTYNRAMQKPVIKTIDGKALTEGTDYTVKWSNASSKIVGTYTVTITGKGDYTGTTKATYKINPMGTSLKTLKKAKRAVTIKWKKQSYKMSSSRINGYQIQLASDRKFIRNKKTVTIKGYKKVSKKVTKLKGGKKYYVRIRTYKTVDGTKYYSPWSKVKTVKVKK